MKVADVTDTKWQNCSQAAQKLAINLFEDNVTPWELMQYPYKLAIDLGGGNSSAVYSNTEDPSDWHTAMLTRLGDEHLWSVVGYADTGKVYIGRDAKNAENCRYYYSNYKMCPTNLNLKIDVLPDNYQPVNGEEDKKVKKTVEQLTKDYMRAFFEAALQFNQPLKFCSRKNILLIVGHPSSDAWKQPECRENLQRIVQEATGVGKVMTMSEAKAAILYAFKNGAYINPNEKVIIFDLGATTADAIWIDRGHRIPKEASINLGGNTADNHLARIALKKSGLEAGDLKTNLALDSRIIKEKHWPKGKESQRMNIRGKGSLGSVNVCMEPKDFQDAVSSKNYAFEVYDELTGDVISDCYTGHLKRFMQETKDLLKIRDVDWVLVTGGAARMTPAMEVIVDMAGKLWAVPEDHVIPKKITDERMNESVTYGSLYYYQKAMTVLNDLPELHSKLNDQAQNLVVPIAQACHEELATYILDKVIEPKVKNWRDHGSGCNEDDFKTVIDDALKHITASQKSEINRIIRNGTAATKNQLSAFQTLITDFLKKHYGTQAGEAAWTPSIMPISPDLFVTLVQDAVEQSMRTFWDKNEEWLLGLFGLVILTVLLLAAAGEVLFDKIYDKFASDKQKEERKQRQVKRQLARDAKGRVKFYNAITKQKTKQTVTKEMKEALTRELTNICKENGFGIPDAFIAQITADIKKAVYGG